MESEQSKFSYVSRYNLYSWGNFDKLWIIFMEIMQFWASITWNEQGFS